MKKKFRAYYKPDFNTPDGPLKFEQVERDDELWFEYDENIRYEFYIPFLDEDWVVQQYVGVEDDTGVEVFEGDIIKYDNNYQCQVTMRLTTSGQDDHPGWMINDLLTQFGNGKYKVIGNILENPKLLDKK